MAFVIATEKPPTATSLPSTTSFDATALTDHDAVYAPNRFDVYDINNTTDYTENTESEKI